MTARQVIAQLEVEGLVIRRRGRGTFVRDSPLPGVLIVDADPTSRFVVRRQAEAAGLRPVEAATPAAALDALKDPGIAIVISDLYLPRTRDGVGLVRAVRRIRPQVVVAVVAARPADLADLFGRPDFPVLVLPKPFWRHQIDRALLLALGRPLPSSEVWARAPIDLGDSGDDLGPITR